LNYNGGATIGHFYQFRNLGDRSYFLQITYRGLFNGTVFLRYNTYQFVSLVGIAYRFNALVTTNCNG
jgi:hypothetical protein